MEWTNCHGIILARACERMLGEPQSGTMAFVRCLTPEVVDALAGDALFAPAGWQVLMVAGENRPKRRTITADRAVEMREAKGDAVLLLVDTELAGAGMDGIYSAAREVDEAILFEEARRLAYSEITRQFSSEMRRFAERAIKKTQGSRSNYGVSRWAGFDFLCRVVAGDKPPGAYLHLLGLWPIADSENPDELNTSLMFVDRLLGIAGASLSPAMRIEAVRWDQSSRHKSADLERFLHEVDGKPLFDALERLSRHENEKLWIGALRIEGPAQLILNIELRSWRKRNGAIAGWSGLIEKDTSKPPVFSMNPNAQKSGRFSTLVVKWTVDPKNLEEGAAEYRVTLMTDKDDPLVIKAVRHSARKNGEQCQFSDDDFPSLDEDVLLPAKVVVEVVGNGKIERQESEEFVICFGELPPRQEIGSVGAKIRTFSEGLAELENRKTVTKIASAPSVIVDDPKGFMLLRTLEDQGRRRSFRVFRPPLIAAVEKQWIDAQGAVGRWTVAVRESGSRADDPQFHPLKGNDSGAETWKRTVGASRNLAKRFVLNGGGGVAQVYDECADEKIGVVYEYLRAWTALLGSDCPSLALANTVEVQSLSGGTVGLIVLPAHPLRVAWQVAYDNLVLCAAFDEKQKAKDIRAEFAGLDGSMFPAFLPNLKGGTFVFADTLGFHAVGMVPDKDKEPKAAVAILARALGENEAADTAPTVGSQSAKVLGAEIAKYLDCHDASRLLHIHALRAGDGMTVARALGSVHKQRCGQEGEDDDDDEEAAGKALAFSLDLYPSEEQRAIAGRFIADAREKRRSGAGVLPLDDLWMLESLNRPGNVNMPRLRWARKETKDPDTAAHLAIAFDTFESRATAGDEKDAQASWPCYAFGLMQFFERCYSSLPSPTWISTVPSATAGEKHPSNGTHTGRLSRLQQAVQDAVSRHLNAGTGPPALRTEISHMKADGLAKLHRLCDWVITLDRNAGIEYFDSPQDNQKIYDAYVIDCVPEREDLGCLQLITSTANLGEVRRLLDSALDQMGLSRSLRNAQFLLEHLKALSGRLAIRLTGHKPATSELIALAISHANCQFPAENDDCWVSLQEGFLVPVDDIRDMLPPLHRKGEDEKETRPDLIYVTAALRKGLIFRFIEVKYRRDLRAARSSDTLKRVDRQIQGLRERWYKHYGQEKVCAAFRAIRRAKLARVLRFYADKAHRHHLPAERHKALVDEIGRMIEKGGDYVFASVPNGDRGWVFCPEYSGSLPEKISYGDSDTQVFLFGSGLLPDSDFSCAVPSPRRIDPRVDPQSRKTQETQPRETQPDGQEKPQQEDGTQGPDDDQDATRPDDGGDPVPDIRLGEITDTNTAVNWRLGVSGNPHLLVAGLPGMGKTTCLVNLCKQMVDANIRPVVFSYHQDIDERLKASVGDVHFVDFKGLGFNPLQVVDRTTWMPHLDVAGSMRDIFTAIYPELGGIQAEHIRKAVKESFDEAGWDSGDRSIIAEPAFGRFLEILRKDPKPGQGLRTLLARLDELKDYGFFDPDFEHGSLWENRLPTVIRIHATQNDNLQRAFSFLVFYGLYKDMFRRGIQKRITHALIFDEAHRAARLSLIPTMAKECRKYGISLVLASQEAKDFDTSVFSAIANYLVLRLTYADAKFLVRNVSSSQQERALIDRIKQMAKYKALYFAEGRSKPSHIALSP